MLAIGINTAWGSMRIWGTVLTAEDNEPAIGASVLVLDGDNNQITGVAADQNGKFDLSIPDTAHAVKITYVGQYDQRFSPGELQNKTIYLHSNPA